ncbi:hypothetical protein ACFL6X_08705 [Candidatus Latescibacterota bacterium]
MSKIGFMAIAVGLVTLMTAGSVSAHHAMEYIEMESYTTARQGEFVFHLHYDHMVDDQEEPGLDHWELTPGVSYGIADRLMLDVHTHFAKFGVSHVVPGRQPDFGPGGPSPFMEAVAASLQYRLTEGWVVDVAGAGTLEVPYGRSEELLGSEDNVYAAMLIVGKDYEGHRNITANLGYEMEGDEDNLSWGLGAKTPISPDSHGIAAGIEILGSLEDAGDNWSILPGVYMPLGTQDITFKTGLEFGKSDGADATRANVTLMYRF